jgi:hypothetical protein
VDGFRRSTNRQWETLDPTGGAVPAGRQERTSRKQRFVISFAFEQAGSIGDDVRRIIPPDKATGACESVVLSGTNERFEIAM